VADVPSGLGRHHFCSSLRLLPSAEPRRVVHVRFAGGHSADVRCIGRNEPEVGPPQMPQGFPVDARRPRADVRAAVRHQPLGEGEQVGCGRRKVSQLLMRRRGEAAGTGHHAIPVEIEPGTAGYRTSMAPLRVRGVGRSPCRRILLESCSSVSKPDAGPQSIGDGLDRLEPYFD
jgi:hypothetical protein